MNREKALSIYNRKSSSKEALREALAFCLGVAYVKKEKVTSIFEACKQFFSEKYKERTGIEYYWKAKDAVALNAILKQLEAINIHNSDMFLLFQHLIHKLPEWYQKNAYSLPVINSKFNDIVRIIKQQNNGKTNISNEYKQQIIRDLFA